MASLLRPILLSLLCCVMALGQLPALLHVVSCHCPAHRIDAHVLSSASQVCSHGCPHAEEQSARAIEDQDVPVEPSHDADDCVICHSLANPVGVVWADELPRAQKFLCELASTRSERIALQTSFAIPQPRGPPLVG